MATSPEAAARHLCTRASTALGHPTAQWEPNAAFDSAPALRLTHWEWPTPGPESRHPDFPHPAVQAKVVWDDDYLGVLFAVEDHFVVARHTNFQDSVCRDSCCEFFVSPLAPHATATTAYFNFEVSANGTMLLRHCTPGQQPKNQKVDEAGWSLIKVKASLVDEVGTAIEPERTEPNQRWQLEYHIPWTLFERYFGPGHGRPAPGQAWSCNFYKCADQSSHPHWGSWAKVHSERPAFHRPADFGTLEFSAAPSPGLADVNCAGYAIVLCDDIKKQKQFCALPRKDA